MQLRSLVFILCLLLFTDALAQLDPSSVLLLNRGSTSSGDSAIDSGRYTIRPRDPNRREEPRPISGRRTNRGDEANEEATDLPPVTVTIPEPPESADKPAEVADAQVEPKGEPEQRPLPPPLEMSRRYNLVELSFAPGYLYSDSSSEFFYRNYTMAAPVLSVDANVWLNPNFALNGSYLSTLSGHINDSLGGSRNVPATHEWFTAGLRLREFFGKDVLANSVTFGVDYFDYKFRVPADAEYREKLSSTGIRVSLEAEIPVTAFRSWLFGVSFSPKLQHREEATETDVRSGSNVDANAVSISIGGRMLFERKGGVFWKVSHSVEKDLFSGEASDKDPKTDEIPTGVSVTNSITIFTFGYTWGN